MQAFCSEKQYKTQIKKWNLDTKYIKGSEYLAMIKTKRRREREDPPKDTLFTLRGRIVDPKDITRFEKRAIKKGAITADESLSDQGKSAGGARRDACRQKKNSPGCRWLT